MTLHLHRAERTDLLAEGLAGLLSEPVADPFAREVVAVPARGVERWLAQRLSHRLGAADAASGGVCAGVHFVSPASLITLLLGRERDDVWLPDQLVWPVLAAIDANIEQDWAQPLARHLGHGEAQDSPRPGRRYSVARRIAGLWHDYGVQRPQVLTDWSTGRDTDGAGNDLPDDLAWQPHLWRAVTEHVGEPTPDVRHQRTVQRLRAGTMTDLDLPGRLSLFGHTRLALTEVELLSALAGHREVHLWLPQTSREVWDRLAPQLSGGPIPRRQDHTARQVQHPLLASLGRDARELQRTVSLAAPVDEPMPAAQAPATVLGLLQHDLRTDSTPDPAERARRVIDPQDTSLQVHACHGPARQVEVLREVLVGLLEDDPTLEPRDVLVMCPDIETYTPLILASFGLDDIDLSEPGAARQEGHPAHRLRVRLADRSLTGTNPLLALAAQLVELSGGRVRAGEVLDLAADPGVARRFGFDTDELETLSRWVEETATRWGLDAGHRGRFQLDWLATNTWAAGLDRLMLGVAVAAAPGRQVGDVMPVDDVDGGASIDLAGRFTEFLERLRSGVDALDAARSAADWSQALGRSVAALAETTADESWQQAQLDRELAGIADRSDDRVSLRRNDIRVMLRHRTSGRPTRSNFRTGTLTVCTMTPMRSVPHRVVCLLGLDDGVFPRSEIPDGDDVLAREPLTGERDRRSEDRQLLLDAVLAAGDHLVLTYSGADEHTGAPKPPAVPLGELIDAAEATATLPQSRPLVVRHPLQGYDIRNLTPGLTDPDRPFSFDAAARAGALARMTPPQPTPLFLPERLAPAATGDVNVADVVRFFDHPAKAFLRDRLEVALVREAEEPEDNITVEVAKGLDTWGLGNRLLQDALSGLPLEEVAAAERRRGQLPPMELGTQTLRAQGRIVQQILTEAQPLRVGDAVGVDVRIELPDGRLLTGTVPGVHGQDAVQVTFSRLGGKQKLQAWIYLLCLNAGAPPPASAAGWSSHVVGRGDRGARAARHSYPAVDQQWAAQRLAELVEVRDLGLREPIPLFAKTSHVFADRYKNGRSQDASVNWAARDWIPDRFPGEAAEEAHQLVYGGIVPLQDLAQAQPEPEESWEPGLSRFGQYAMRVWRPALTGPPASGGEV
ncbi:exodeoxyribonuclease V subunit gamma [Dermacoccaceae bacterium W4C1]